MPWHWYSPPPVDSSSRALLLAALVGLGGCAGWRDSGDTYYRHRVPKKLARKETTYSFGLPGEAWRPVRDIKGVQVMWTHAQTHALIQVHVQCDEHGDSDLQQYTDHLRIDFTDWKVLSQEDETLLGRAALRTVVEAKLDGVPVKLELWVVKRAGCLFDLHYVAARDKFAVGEADFARVVDALRFTP